MANNSTPDVFLLLGVEGGSNIGRGSGEMIHKTLKQILANIEKEGLSVKINAEIGNKAELERQISESLKDISTSTREVPIPISVQVSRESVINSIQEALNGNLFNINLSAGGITFGAAGGQGSSAISKELQSKFKIQGNNGSSKPLDVSNVNELANQLGEAGVEADNIKKTLEQIQKLSFHPLKIQANIDPIKKGSKVERVVTSVVVSGINDEGVGVRRNIVRNKKTGTYTVGRENVDYNIAKLIKDQQALQKENQKTAKTATDIYEQYKKLEAIARVWQVKYSSVEGMSNITTAYDKAKEVFAEGSTADIDAKRRATADLNAEIKALGPTIKEVAKKANEASKDVDKLIPQGTVNRIDRYNRKFNELSRSNSTVVNNSAAAHTINDINAVRTAIENNNFDSLKDSSITNYKEAIKELNRLLSIAQEELSKVTKEVNSLDRATNNAANAQARAASFIKDFTNISQTQYKIDDNPSYAALQNQKNKIERLYNVVQDGENNFNASQLDIEGINTYAQAVKYLIHELAIAEPKLREFKKTASNITDNDARVKLEEYKRVLKELQESHGSGRVADVFKKNIIPNNLKTEAEVLKWVKQHYDEITIAIRNVRNETDRLEQEYREEQNIVTQRNKIYQEAENYYKKYQSGIRANITLNQQWQDLLRKINNGGFIDNESARSALAELQTATKDANAETMTLWGSLKKLFTDHFGSVSATAAIGTLRNIIREAYQDVLDMDKAMTELRKVTNLAEVQYESFGRKAAEMAKRVGGSITDTINSTADFARLGFNIDDASALAEAALVYKNVGDGLSDINEASESIISTIKAFSDVDASDAMSIIDKFNEVGNNFAISSSGIGTALQKSAAALSSANNTLDESIALITAGNSVVQNPEIIGSVMPM